MSSLPYLTSCRVKASSRGRTGFQKSPGFYLLVTTASCFCRSLNIAATETGQRRAFASKILTFADKPPAKLSTEDQRILQAIQYQKRQPAVPHWGRLEQALSCQPSIARAAPLLLLDALDPDRLVVPDIEHAAARRCHLTLRSHAQRFADSSVNHFLSELFHSIAASAIANVTLSRFGLFHGHLFVTRSHPHNLGVLFHTMEYPALGPDFDINLGYCQVGSDLVFNQTAWDFRNWLFYKEKLIALDASRDSIIYERLVSDDLKEVRTILESDFGLPLADINFFNSLDAKTQEAKLFVCPLSESRSSEPSTALLSL